MTSDAYIETLQKRLAHGLPLPVSTGDKSLDERITVALELHRLLPHCQQCSVRYVIRIIYLRLMSCQPDKHKIAACTDLYARLMVAIGDHKWPAPNIPNNKHDAIRIKLQQTNAVVQSALDGEPITTDQRNLLRLATDSDIKQQIKEAEQAAKAARKSQSKAKGPANLSDDEIRDLSLDIRSGSCKAVSAGKVKKITNGGYSPLSASTETRKAAKEESERRIHELYREKYGYDVANIPRDIRRKLTKGMTEESYRRRKEVKREQTLQRQQQIADEQMTYVTHKVRLSPNNLQKNYLQRCFGVSRFVYNWCYDRRQEARNRGERIFPGELAKQFTDIARSEYPFTYQVTSCAKQSGFEAFSAAMQSLYDGKGFPQRKRRKLGGSFSYSVTGYRKQPILSDHNPDVPDSQPSARRQYLLIPSFGYIKMQEKLRFRGILTSVTIKQEADGRYYACLKVCVTPAEWQRTHRSADIYIDRPVGIDLGAGRDLAILSNGLRIEGRKTDKHLWQRKRELQQAIYRKRDAHPGHTSRNQKRLAASLAGVKARIARQNLDHQHKVSTTLAYTYKNICMENLNVRAMMNGELPAYIIKNATLYQFRTLMEQKAELAGHAVTLAEKGYPSSHICSRCGHQTELALSQRTFRCPQCGYEADRDLNAAINLAKLIGLDGPESDYAANSATTALLTRSGIATHQTEIAEQAGCAP